MSLIDQLKLSFGNAFDLEPVHKDVLRLYAPLFHEDGDMLSIYLETHGDEVTIRDYGNTLMRVSYTFDLDSENKQSIISRIASSNYGELDDGELIIRSNKNRLVSDILQYSQLVSKVSNIDILSRETVRSMFYEYLDEFITGQLARYNIRKNVYPTSDKQLMVDYELPCAKPIYMFGVNDNSKAYKTTISCLNYQKRRLQFSSLIIYEDMESLTKFNRRQLTNASDKQFASLDDFVTDGPEYIERALAS